MQSLDGPCSDRLDEFVERGGDAEVLEPSVSAEFVVAASQVLDKGVAGDDHVGGPVAFEAAHGSEPGLQSSVVCLDPVVGVPGGVVTCTGEELVDRAGEGPARSVVTSTGGPCSAIADRKNRVAAAVSRLAETYTSMT